MKQRGAATLLVAGALAFALLATALVLDVAKVVAIRSRLTAAADAAALAAAPLTFAPFGSDSQPQLAAATIAASSGVSALADEEQSKSPGDKLGVAVVGVKGRGGSHIGAFAGRKDTEILYIVDADRAVGRKRPRGLSSSLRPMYSAIAG